MIKISRSISKSLFTKFSPLKAFFGGGHHEPIVPFDDSGKVVIDSIKSTIKGFADVNHIEEHNPDLSEAEKKTMKRFLIYRSNPSVLMFP